MSEREAAAKVQAYVAELVKPWTEFHGHEDAMASIIKEYADRRYREAIEAAARVAEEWLCGNCNTWSQEPRDCCARPDWSRQREPSETAQAIRALGEKADGSTAT
jgi:hypothetical protein